MDAALPNRRSVLQPTSSITRYVVQPPSEPDDCLSGPAIANVDCLVDNPNGEIDTQHKLSFYYQNVRGLRTKIDNFFLAVSASCYDVIVLTETWLNDQILSPQLFGSSYTVFRNDRNRRNSRKSRGGGVLIAVSTRISSSIDPSSVHYSLEQIWVRLNLSGLRISIGVIYLPPDRKTDLTSINNHVESLESVFFQFERKRSRLPVWRLQPVRFNLEHNVPGMPNCGCHAIYYVYCLQQPS